jgi:hypothetical protein
VREADLLSIVTGGDLQIRRPEPDRERALMNEAEIFKSRDVAAEVVKRIGCDRILNGTEVTNLEAATSVIQANVKVEVPEKSDVLTISFRHSDPTVVQKVLGTLIDVYSAKSIQLHAPVPEDFVLRQVEDLRSISVHQREALLDLQRKLGVTSIEDAKKASADEVSRIRTLMLSTEAELSEQSGILKEPEISTEQAARIRSLQARSGFLRSQFTNALAKAQTIIEAEPKILEMRRSIEQKESDAFHISARLKQASFQNEISAERNVRIAIVQEPTPAALYN